MEDHPEINTDIIRQIPELIDNPVVIIQSLTKKDSVILFGELKGTNGNTVMASVKLVVNNRNNAEIDIEMITSAYTRSGGNIQYLLDTSPILYIDPNKKRTNSWYKHSGCNSRQR